MIKTILFDMDGVLFDDKNLHYEALNTALGNEFAISMDLHISKFDGLQTRKKLEILSNDYGFPKDLHEKVWREKQDETVRLLSKVGKHERLVSVLSELQRRGFVLGVCSNSVRKTVLKVLSNMGLMGFMDVVLSNDDVRNAKPHPEIYWKAMSLLGVVPENTLIVEDSPTGLLAAHRSGAHVHRVKNPDDIVVDNLVYKVESICNDSSISNTSPKWDDQTLNVVIPMAGAGTRFFNAGYSFPKPLIDVDGKPMIQLVVESLKIRANFTYLVQKEHNRDFNIKSMLNLITPGCNVIEVDGVTEGAASTALLAKDIINNENPVLFANSDQYIEWDSSQFMYKMTESGVDGGILTFESYHPKWSFAKVNENGFVTEVAEKNPISNMATVGLYYWKRGSDFVKYAEQMIFKDIRVNDEFYLCPVYNEAIQDGKKITTSGVQKMWGLGTPEDLRYFLDSRSS